MNILGIESTAHTFGVAVVTDKGKTLANCKSLYSTEEGAGGMIPNEVAKHHRQVADKILSEALAKAGGLSLKDIGLISYSRGPGLAPSLKVGLEFAKKLASENKIPIIGVNHCCAHLTIGDLMTGAKDAVYLYVSGVNTQVIAATGGRFRIFGETLDIGLGNALDKVGRELGLGFPAGPKMEALAKTGKLIDLPYVVKGMDVSFAGLVTKAVRLFNNKKATVEDICFSLQEICFAMLAEVSERAMAHTGKNELLLIGGVAANKRLCQMLDIMCKERGAKFFAVPLEYAGDQAAQIAWQGWLEYNAAKSKENFNAKAADIFPYERTDEIEISWK